MSDEFPLRNLVRITEAFLHRLIPVIYEYKLDSKKRNGGVLIVTRAGPNQSIPVLMITIGSTSEDMRTICQRWALEKIISLDEHPEHVSSWLVRNPEKNRWGGAIRTNNYLFSFSGLEEDEDEVLMVLVAIKLGFITEAEAIEKILRPSGSIDLYEKFKEWQ